MTVKYAEACAQRAGLLLCWHLCSSSPELKPNTITDDEVKSKSSIELHLIELLLYIE
jgi:hypothetical protein